MQIPIFGEELIPVTLSVLLVPAKTEVFEMTQCEHEFQLDPASKEVRCIKCGDRDDEMELQNQAAVIQEIKDDFYKSQVSFE